MELTPRRVVAAAVHRASERAEPLVAFWLPVDGDRSRVLEEIRSERAGMPVIPLVVRQGFANPNALLDDLVMLLELNRDDVLSAVQEAYTEQVILVLLARTELGIPQLSSPATLPSWFPRLGGMTISVIIESLLATAAAPLNAPECHVDEIVAELFAVEEAILDRLQAVRGWDHRLGNAFFELIRDRKRETEKFAEFLEAARVSRGEVSTPSAFRPSARDGRSLVGRLLRLVSASSPDQLLAASRALGTALALDGVPLAAVPDSLAAVLLRGTTWDPDTNVRVCRNILVTIYAASQFATGAAHADQYPMFPVVLLRGLSYNLRQTLRRISVAVPELPTQTHLPTADA